MARTRDLANAPVALPAVLGSRSVEILATPNLITRGSRASRPAKASSHSIPWIRDCACLFLSFSINAPPPPPHTHTHTHTHFPGAPTTIAASRSTSAMISNVCPKCGTDKRSGKRTCCAPGGAWVKKCGIPGDSKFDHTWLEGIQACNSTLLNPNLNPEP